MPLPKGTDEKYFKRLDELIEGFESLIEPLRQAEIQAEFYSNSGMDDMIELDIVVGNSPNVVNYHRYTMSADNLVQTLLGKTKSQRILEGIKDGGAAASSERYLAVLKGLKDDFDAGILDVFSGTTETNMDNPHELPAPEDPIARVDEFARDLAWGVAHGLWGPGFRILLAGGSELQWLSLSPGDAQTNLHNLRIGKWKEVFPESHLLQALGYLEPNFAVKPVEFQPAFLLTQKSFSLLEKPADPPEVFISYRHDESSALALLVEARLLLFNLGISVFIDREIQKGEDWKERIKKAVEDAEVFVCILGPDFAKSKMMPIEIDWAVRSGSRLITILHNNFSDEDNCPEILKRKQWIKVQEENAEEYDIAILKLLNALGYSTLQSPRPSVATTN